jgi:hypothetical protein
MSDRLEEFVQQNREAFDNLEPDPSIWLKINPANVPVHQERRSFRWLRVAAAIALIFAGSSAGVYFLTGGKTGPERLSDELYRQILETEQYYNQMVAQRFDELRPYLVNEPATREMLRTDLDELDQVYLELKEDLKDNVSNPVVIEAMILNYTVKLEILEDLLDQLKEKETQDENNGSYSL